MSGDIFLLLVQDGLTTGAIYLLLAVGLLLVFSVTRVIFIPQGDFVAYGTLSFAALLAHRVPGTLWLLDGLALLSALISLRHARLVGWRGFALRLGPPAALTAASLLLLRLWPAPLPLGIVAVGIVAALGPLVYRFAFAPISRSPLLALLIVAMAVHYVLIGLGLIFFGPEAASTPAFTDASIGFAGEQISGQSLCVYAAAAVLVAALRWAFGRTLYGRALRAAASNALGAKLVGIDEGTTGRLAFLLAAALGGFAGILIGAVTPIGYDTGFILGLKGFVAAIIGGLASYPLAAAGALVVGIAESFADFWASAYRDVIVFTLIIPVLVWLSLRRPGVEDG
jgi:branched-chain amino acid transport system permease protein